MSALPCPALRGSGKFGKFRPGENRFLAVMFYCCDSDRWVFREKLYGWIYFQSLISGIFSGDCVGRRYGYVVLKKLSYIGPISLEWMDLNFPAKFWMFIVFRQSAESFFEKYCMRNEICLCGNVEKFVCMYIFFFRFVRNVYFVL